MKNEQRWIIRNAQTVFKTRIFEIVEQDCFLPSKNVEHPFISIRLPDWVNVVAITEDSQALMVRQHRLGKDMITTEVPAGVLHDGEPPEMGALRELKEETGYTPSQIILLKKIYVNPAIQNNINYFFLATGCRKASEQELDESEDLDVCLFDLDTLFAVRTNEHFENSMTLAAILLAKDYLLRH